MPGTWITLSTGRGTGNFCGVCAETFFPFLFFRDHLHLVNVMVTCKEGVGKLKKVDRNISWELSDGDKMKWPTERWAMTMVCGPTSVDTVNFPTVPRRPVWHHRQQLQSADCLLQSLHQSLHRLHSRRWEQMEIMWAQAGLASWHHHTK